MKYKRYEAKPPGEPKDAPKKWYARLVSDILTDMLDCVQELVLDGKKGCLGRHP